MKLKDLFGVQLSLKDKQNKPLLQSQLLRTFQQSWKTSLECIIWKGNGSAHDNNASESQTYNTFVCFDCYYLKQLFLLWDDNAQWFYRKIHVPHNLPAAMSKIYTSGYVNTLEGCFLSSARKLWEVAIDPCWFTHF